MRIKTASRLAEAYHCDPIDILNSDLDEWIIRIACAKVLQRDNAEREKARNR